MMMPPTPLPPGWRTIDLAVLGRYLDGSAAPEERAAIEAWIGADSERQAAITALQTAWDADAQRLGAPYDTNAAWARVAGGGGRVPRSWWRPLAIAAGVVVAVGAGAQWWLNGDRDRITQPPLREYTTPRGRRAAFRFADGTEITLNVASRLRVPVRFAPHAREVYLDGEAYFSVGHDAARPFVVHTPHGTIRDLGTKFGVHAYGDAATARAAVAEGAVALAATPVQAGQVATLSPAGAVRVLRNANVMAALAWTHGRLVFRSTPLADVAEQLGRWYDLDVVVADPRLARRPVTGSYGAEPVAQVLTLITAAVGARYEWQGRLVTISTLNAPR